MDIFFHPDLMVFGAIGGFLLTEKLELMEKFKIGRKFRISRLTLLMLFSGVYIATFGMFISNPAARYLGLVLVIAASLLFFHYMTSRRNPGLAGIKNVFGAAVFALTLSAVANLNHFITDSTEFSYLVLLFPVVYIIAERMELGFVRGMKLSMIRVLGILSWISVIIAFSSAELGSGFVARVLTGASIAILLSVILTSMAYDPTFRKLRKKSRLQSFMQKGIVISFIWLFLGIALFMLQLIQGHGLLDPAAHSIALGFIGTFIVSHSPIIFPLTLKKKANQDNVTYLPLIVITIANIMRIAGDLTISFSLYSSILSYASGYVIILAILAFAYNLKRIMPAQAPLQETATA